MFSGLISLCKKSALWRDLRALKTKYAIVAVIWAGNRCPCSIFQVWINSMIIWWSLSSSQLSGRVPGGEWVELTPPIFQATSFGVSGQWMVALKAWISLLYSISVVCTHCTCLLLLLIRLEMKWRPSGSWRRVRKEVEPRAYVLLTGTRLETNSRYCGETVELCGMRVVGQCVKSEFGRNNMQNVGNHRNKTMQLFFKNEH